MDGTTGVLVPRGFAWDRSVSTSERRLLIERILRLPAWFVGDPQADNLDVKPMSGHEGLYRLRSGSVRALFQRLGTAVIVHRVDRRGNAYEDHEVDAIKLVRSGEGLRPLAGAAALPAASLPSKPARAPTVPKLRATARVEQNPLTIFTDQELEAIGLEPETIRLVRAIPPITAPDASIELRSASSSQRQLVVEIWERPEGVLEAVQRGDVGSIFLDDDEAVQRLASEDSETSFVSVDSVDGFEAILAEPIEDWMLYLHPLQRRPVAWTRQGPVRVTGAAGTGKTVVALHRARALAERHEGRVLLTTFVSTLPKVWQGLFAGWEPGLEETLDIRTLDHIALELHHLGGGGGRPAEDDWLLAQVEELHRDADGSLGGLTVTGLFEEFEYVIAGRDLDERETYFSLPRRGRGTPLQREERRAVWDLYERYLDIQDEAGRYSFATIRASALEALRTGATRRRYAAVVVDESQDLTEVAARLVVELAGGGDRPAVTFVGDGQQSVYPGGFSLRSLGIDVRGRSVVLRQNWRNAYPIWLVASALLAGEEFVDLDDELHKCHAGEGIPVRDGPIPRLHVFPGTASEAMEWLAEVLRELLAGGIDPGDCAVLAPSNAALTALERAVKAAGVPVRKLQQYAGEHGEGVWLGTFHRAKGLEFKRVVIFGLDADTWPPRIPGLRPEAQDELRARWHRAAFVAMTRARDVLEVVVPGRPAPELEAASWAFEIE